MTVAKKNLLNEWVQKSTMNEMETWLYQIGLFFIGFGVILMTMAFFVNAELLPSFNLMMVCIGLGGALIGFAMWRTQFSKGRYMIVLSCIAGLMGMLMVSAG